MRKQAPFHRPNCLCPFCKGITKEVKEQLRIQNSLIRIGLYCRNKKCENIVLMTVGEYLWRIEKTLSKRAYCSQKCAYEDPILRKEKSEAAMKKYQDPKEIEKLREAQKKSWQDPNSTYNSLEYKMKQSKRWQGKKNPAYRGDWGREITFEPYGPEFNKELRLFIRQRDDFTCQICGAKENGRDHDCHHIDYDKKNNNEWNLITLCRPNHQMTSYNREKWELCLTVLNEIRLC